MSSDEETHRRFRTAGVRRARAWVLPLVLAAVIASLASCKGVADIDVDLNAKGAGVVGVTVRLDAAAAGQVGNPKNLLRVADLRSMGWKISEPRAVADGGLVITAKRDVAGPRQAEAALHQLAGAGVFDSIAIRRVGKPLKEQIRVSGSADLRRGIESFGDERVREVTGSELVSLLGEPSPESVQMRLRANLAGTRTDIPLLLGESRPVQALGGRWSLDFVLPVLSAIGALFGLGLLRFYGRT